MPDIDRSDKIYQLIYQKLQELAKAEKLTTYKEISHLAGFETENRAEMGLLGEILHEINRQEHDQDRPLLSALVTREGGGIPGNGFFESARRLRAFEGTDADKKPFWEAEVHRVHDFWMTR